MLGYERQEHVRGNTWCVLLRLLLPRSSCEIRQEVLGERSVHARDSEGLSSCVRGRPAQEKGAQLTDQAG